MSAKMKTIGALCWAIASFLAARAAGEGDGPAKPPANVKAQLIADVTAVVPGKPFNLGVRFEIQREWHIYWKYSGDTGRSTEVKWKLPAGFEASPLIWPAPVKIVDPGDLLSYAYEERVLLWSEVRPPKDLKGGDKVALAADVSWLACKTLCVPGSTSVSLELPVVAASDASKAAHADIFAAARARVPIPSEKASRFGVRTGLNVDRVRPGDRFEVGVRLTVEKGWHVQSNRPLEEGMIATDLFLAPPDVIALERPVFPPGKVKSFGEGLRLSVYEGDALIRIPARATADLKPGPLVIEGVLVAQICSDEGLCLRPQYIAVQIPVIGAAARATVTPADQGVFSGGQAMIEPPHQAAGAPPGGQAAVLPVVPSEARPATSASGDAAATSVPPRSLVYLLFAAFLAGPILNVMPCVLPVVSIKILSFVQQAGEESRRILILGLSFALGMMIFFWGLGLLAVVVPVSPGSALRHPIGVIILTTVIFAFALSLFGVFEIRLPGRAAATLGSAATREGPFGALAKGFLATVLGTSCTAPVVSTVWVSALAASAPTRLLIFTSMGLGMAGPYLILSAKPGWLRFIPKPGAWMDAFKQFMGFIMLATALWLLWVLGGQVGSDGIVWTLCFLTCVAMGLWLIGRIGYGATPRRWLGTYAASIVIMTLGGYWTLGNAVAKPVAHDVGGVATNDPRLADLDYSQSIPWQLYRPGLAEALAKDGRVVYVDYTARWCATCQSNKRLVLETAGIRSLRGELNVVPLKADFTNGGADIERDLARFNRPSVPLNLVYGPGHAVHPIVLPELLTAERVSQALRAAAEGKPGSSSSSDRPSPGGRGIDCATIGALALGAVSPAEAGKESGSVSGRAFAFGPSGGTIAGAQVTVLERPDLQTVVDKQGNYRIDGLKRGEEFTLVLKKAGFKTTQLATLFMPDQDLDFVAFQVPPHYIFVGFSALLGMRPDPNACHIATTVMKVGASGYDSLGADKGEPGATVTLDPPLPAKHGPIYFQFLPDKLHFIYPDRSLKQTTRDGGVLFVDVPPGEYTLRAHKPGVEFTPVKLKCRPGVLVNAAPPYGPRARER